MTYTRALTISSVDIKSK